MIESNIFRLNVDGTLDNSFDFGTGTLSGFRFRPVLVTAIQKDNKIIIGGSFTTYNGIPRNRIARLNSNGTLDQSFNIGNGCNGDVTACLIQSDGKIIIGGNFTYFNGIKRTYLARLNSDGTLDSTFDPMMEANSNLTSIALQKDGKILVGGQLVLINGSYQIRITRLNSDGTLDPSFNSNILDIGVNDIKIQEDSRIVIAGGFTSINNNSKIRIARLNNPSLSQPQLNNNIPSLSQWGLLIICLLIINICAYFLTQLDLEELK